MPDFLTYADVVRNDRLDDDNDSVQGITSERSGVPSSNNSSHGELSDSGNGSEIHQSQSAVDSVDTEAITEMMGHMNIDWRSYRTPLSVSIFIFLFYSIPIIELETRNFNFLVSAPSIAPLDR